MNLPIATCLICGQQKELSVWVDPTITGGSFHGVCASCRIFDYEKRNLEIIKTVMRKLRVTDIEELPMEVDKFVKIYNDTVDKLNTANHTLFEIGLMVKAAEQPLALDSGAGRAKNQS